MIPQLLVALFAGFAAPASVPTPSAAPGLGMPDDRAELAVVLTELLPLFRRQQLGEELSGDESDQRRLLKRRVAALLERVAPHLLDSDDDAIEDFFHQVLVEHAPDSVEVLRVLRAGKPLERTQGCLGGCSAMLGIYYSESGSYPSTEEGLRATLEYGYGDERGLLDGWGREVRYESDGFTYTVWSLGEDGVDGNADDWLLGDEDYEPRQRGAASSPFVQSESLRQLPGDVTARGIVLGGNGEVLVEFVRDGERHLLGPDGEVVAEPWRPSLVLEGTKERLDRDADGDWRHVGVASEDIGRPLLDGEGRLIAFRERVGDEWFVRVRDRVSPPYRWASEPTLLPLPQGAQVAYRSWDGERMTVHVGDQRSTSAWAGRPRLAPGGGTVAFIANEGGVPGERFEERRARHERPAWGREPDEVRDHDVLDGGTYHVVANGVAGPRYAGVDGLAFSHDGGRFAYRAQGEDGSWRIVVHDGEEVTEGEPAELVGRPLFDGTEGRLAYISDGSALCIEGLEPLGWPGVGDLVAGSAGLFGCVVRDEDGWSVVLLGPDLESSWRAGPFLGADVLGFLLDGSSPYAQVQTDAGRGYLFGSFEAPKYDELFDLVIAGDDLVAYAGREAGLCRLVVIDFQQGEVFENTGELLTGTRAPILLEDRRVLFHVSEGGTPSERPGYEPARDAMHRLMVFDGSEWHASPAFGWVMSPTVAPDGAIHFVATLADERQAMCTFRDGAFTVGTPYREVRWADMEFLDDGRFVYVAEDEGGGFIVTDGEAGPVQGFISIFRILGGEVVTHWVSRGDDGEAFVANGRDLGTHQEVQDLWLLPDGRTLIHRALDGATETEDDDLAGGRQSLVLHDVPASAETEPATLALTYDLISGVDVAEDGSSLSFVALEGGQLQRVRVDLVALRADWDAR